MACTNAWAAIRPSANSGGSIWGCKKPSTRREGKVPLRRNDQDRVVCMPRTSVGFPLKKRFGGTTAVERLFLFHGRQETDGAVVDVIIRI